MDIIKTFGSWIQAMTPENPGGARRLLLAGYRAQKLNLAFRPDRRLPPSRNYAAEAVLDVVLRALSRPERAALVSIFTPCEILGVSGITPYSMEALSGFLAGTKCDKVFLERAAGEGVPETLCSFHRVFLGAGGAGLLPAPRFIVYTNLACDGNMITFPHLAEKYGVPSFFIDVPYEKSEDAVRSVAGQLRGLAVFVSDVTGRPVSEDALAEAVSRSAGTAEDYIKYLDLQKERRLPGDLTGEMYALFMSHILLGTESAEKFGRMLLRDMERAPRSRGLRLLWLHVIPYLQEPVRQLLNFSDRAFVTACDLAYESMVPMDPTKPFESMARRMVYSCFNGSPEGRIAKALETAERTGADGAVIFAHWGCKSTLGASRLMKKALEEAGLPTLILDGDACAAGPGGEGQTATRMGAFIEMLEERRK